jgi:hypothetical protein
LQVELNSLLSEKLACVDTVHSKMSQVTDERRTVTDAVAHRDLAEDELRRQEKGCQELDAKVQRMRAECQEMEHRLGLLNLDISKGAERNCYLKDSQTTGQAEEQKFGNGMLGLRKEKDDLLHQIRL